MSLLYYLKRHSRETLGAGRINFSAVCIRFFRGAARVPTLGKMRIVFSKAWNKSFEKFQELEPSHARVANFSSNPWEKRIKVFYG